MIAEEIRKIVEAAAERAALSGGLPPATELSFSISRPKEEFGDYACNVGFIAAKEWKIPPVQAARFIRDHLETSKNILNAEVVGGYINFFLAPHYWRRVLPEIASQKREFGWRETHVQECLMIEFVSANPTGPLHVGHGRYAAFGDCLARMLETQGYDVYREFYLNDHGAQMEMFRKSVLARYKELLGQKVSFPANGYRGQYVIDIARELMEKENNLPISDDRIATEAHKQIVSHLEKILDKFRVKFDNWFSERELHEKGQVEEALELMKSRGFAYEREGALWFRSSDFGDDKDRVLKRSDGTPTYFAADVAYHINKLNRGFDRVINIWGADHHGYVKRVTAVVDALGYGGRLEIIIGQLVSLWRGGEPVRLSKRTGEIITLEELIEEVGVDAARYFLVLRGPDTAIDFDLDLAKEQSAENPVYYVQYAHARISSILRLAQEQGFDPSLDSNPDIELLNHDQEIRLMKQLSHYSDLLADSAEARAPQRLATFSQQLATQFHLFYRDCRVIGEDRSLSESRLFLVGCTRQVLANILGLLGVSAPERM